MKQLFGVIQIFAFINLLFVPSLLFVAALVYLLGSTQTWWFAAISVSALFGNLWIVVRPPFGDKVWRKINAIAGNRPGV